MAALESVSPCLRPSTNSTARMSPNNSQTRSTQSDGAFLTLKLVHPLLHRPASRPNLPAQRPRLHSRRRSAHALLRRRLRDEHRRARRRKPSLGTRASRKGEYKPRVLSTYTAERRAVAEHAHQIGQDDLQPHLQPHAPILHRQRLWWRRERGLDRSSRVFFVAVHHWSRRCVRTRQVF